MKIAILEDDLMLGELIKEHLSTNNQVILFSNGDEIEEYIYDNKIDLLLLDINVPGLKGDKLLKNIRSNNNKTPVIFITSQTSSKDIKNGFELGCDDYIKKPFEFEELDARIEYIKKVYNIEQIVEVNGYIFDVERNILKKDKELINLTPKASLVLNYLIKNRGKVVSKDELIENLWGDDIPTESTLRTYIKMLRRIFPNIKTYRGNGYEFE